MFRTFPVVKHLSKGVVGNCYKRFASNTMASLQTVVAKLNEFAPENLAEEWDNVGLLIEPYAIRPIQNILLTIDLTTAVMGEAESMSADLIISYHPPIFAPFKRFTCQTRKGFIINECIRRDIAVYSPHTSWDSINGGVNDWLAAALPLENSQPILKNPTNPLCGAGRICKVPGGISLLEAIGKIRQHTGVRYIQYSTGAYGGQQINTFAVCAGSGASVLKGVKADLYITGEMSHHEILEAQEQNIHVVLLGHCNSERGFLPGFSGILSDLLKDYSDVTVHVSKSDRSPLLTSA